jgi:hypothetical protein
LINGLSNQPLMMILLLLKRGLEHVGYFDAPFSLRKDLSVRDHPGHTVSCEGYMALALVV